MSPVEHDLFEHLAHQRLPLVKAHTIEIGCYGSRKAFHATEKLLSPQHGLPFVVELLYIYFKLLDTNGESSCTLFEISLVDEASLIRIDKAPPFHL